MYLIQQLEDEYFTVLLFNLPLSIGGSCLDHLCRFRPGCFETQLRSREPRCASRACPALWGLSHTCLNFPHLWFTQSFCASEWNHGLGVKEPSCTRGCWVQEHSGQTVRSHFEVLTPLGRARTHPAPASYPCWVPHPKKLLFLTIPAWVRLLEWLFSLCSPVKWHLAGLENQQKHFPAATAVPECIVLVSQCFAEDVGDRAAVSIAVSLIAVLVQWISRSWITTGKRSSSPLRGLSWP